LIFGGHRREMSRSRLQSGSLFSSHGKEEIATQLVSKRAFLLSSLARRPLVVTALLLQSFCDFCAFGLFGAPLDSSSSLCCCSRCCSDKTGE